MNNEIIKGFYNNFVDYQISSGVNERVYSLYKRMLSLGLKKESRVLELGCGIGTMTVLLSRKISEGIIEAVDISDKSVSFAKTKIKRDNVWFFANDIVNYKPANNDFDFVILFDVIEHIPIEKHFQLFKNLSDISTEKTKILINIPNPEYLKYDIKNNSASLQIIDLPIPLDLILDNVARNGLQILKFETYSVWVKNDYQFFYIQKRRDFEEEKLSDRRNLFQKITHKLKVFYVSKKYNYH